MRLGSVILVAAGALSLTLSGCRPAKPKAVFIDPALETLVPSDTIFAAGADFDSIRTTHVFQKYLGQVSLPQLDDFTKKTGIDPRKNLWQVISCSNGKTALFMARGKFSEGDAEPRISLDGIQRMSYKNFPIFGDERTGVIFMNSSTAAAGRTQDLHAIVDRRDSGAQGFPPALRARVESINHSQQVWAAFSGGVGGLTLGAPANSNLAQALQAFRGITAGTLSADIREGLNFQGHLECRTDSDAKHLHDALKGIIGLGRLSTPDNQPDMLRLYDAIAVNQDGTNVDVTAKVPAALEDKFLDLWLKNR